jgi:hypothetical protein
MKVALYARVSTERQAERGTIGSQPALLRRHVTAVWHELVGEYVDDGHSGARLDRPGLDALRDAAEGALFEQVRCLSPDRMARAYAYQMQTAIYNGARAEEYEEIVDRCRDFLAEIDKEIAATHFTYAELEENDVDLTKLRSWFGKVSARDVLGARRREQAQSALADCAAALDAFANHVYLTEDRE